MKQDKSKLHSYRSRQSKETKKSGVDSKRGDNGSSVSPTPRIDLQKVGMPKQIIKEKEAKDAVRKLTTK